MNYLDRMIRAISPEAALRRAEARQRLALLDGYTPQSSHRGGLATRTSTPWGRSTSYAGGTFADRINKADRRDRARRVFQEHAIGRSLLQTETDNVVASGLHLQAVTDSKAFNGETEDRWTAWLEVADIRGMACGSELMRQVYRSPRRDGDGGIVLVDRGGESRLQFIPGDLISTPQDRGGDPLIIDGIEVDSATRPRAFHCLYATERGTKLWERVPASNFIYLAPVIDDDLGLRGDSCYSQIFPQLDQIDGYIDAVLIAARMAAVFGLLFKEQTAAKTFAGLGTTTNSAGNAQKAVTLENGSLRYIGREDDVVQVQAQQPMQQTPDFIRVICRLLGLPFDMPLELVLKDLSQVNFASARIGLIGYYRACRAKQRAFIARWDRIYQWWLSREVKLQRFSNSAPQDFWRHRFGCEGWDYTDPVSEAQADQLQIDMGIKSHRMAAMERGRDWDEIQVQLQAEKAVRRLAGLAQIQSTYTRHPQSGVGATSDPLGYVQVELPSASEPEPATTSEPTGQTTELPTEPVPANEGAEDD